MIGKKLKDAYRIVDFDEQKYERELKEKLAALAKHNIPTVILSNTKDDIVPYSENGLQLINAYSGSNFILEILRKDIGHHPHGYMSKEALDFIENKTKD